MLKLASMIFTILGSTLAGIAVLVVLVVPSLTDQGMTMIPIAALIGALLGLPLSYWVARKIISLQKTATV